MSFSACKRGLLSPTRCFAIICAIARSADLPVDLTTLLVAKAMVIAALHSVFRSLPDYYTLASKLNDSFRS